MRRASSTTTPAFREPDAELLAELLRDLVAAAAQRELVLLAVIVGVEARDAANGGFALDLDVALVVFDVEDGLRRILDAPDHDGRDLDGVAALVVDLERLAVEVVRAQRELGRELRARDRAVLQGQRPDLHALRHGRSARNVTAVARVQRVRPMEAAAAHGALVGAEQDQDACLVRLQREEAEAEEHAEADHEESGPDAQTDLRGREPALGGRGAHASRKRPTPR